MNRDRNIPVWRLGWVVGIGVVAGLVYILIRGQEPGDAQLLDRVAIDGDPFEYAERPPAQGEFISSERGDRQMLDRVEPDSRRKGSLGKEQGDHPEIKNTQEQAVPTGMAEDEIERSMEESVMVVADRRDNRQPYPDMTVGIAVRSRQHQEDAAGTSRRPADGGDRIAVQHPLPEDDADTSESAITATPEQLLQLVKKFESAQDGSEQRKILDQISALDNPDLIPMLAELLRVAADSDIRDASQQALAIMVDADLLAWLIEQVHDASTIHERDQWLGVLRRAQDPVLELAWVEAAQWAREIGDVDLLAASYDTLAIMGTESAVQFLFAQWSETGGADGEQHLADAIARCWHAASLPVIKDVLLSEFPSTTIEMQVAAARALGNYEADLVLETLLMAGSMFPHQAIQSAVDRSVRRIRGETGQDFTER